MRKNQALHELWNGVHTCISHYASEKSLRKSDISTNIDGTRWHDIDLILEIREVKYELLFDLACDVGLDHAHRANFLREFHTDSVLFYVESTTNQ
jgi:hypothetical protein